MTAPTHPENVGSRTRAADIEAVTIPRHVVIRALSKARLLYIGACVSNDQDPGPDDECWAEFERLAEYVEVSR